jgi:alpha-beta hydrolase superfamily lysophospholipase
MTSENGNSATSTERALWLALDPQPVFGFLHLSERPAPHRAAVLLCPPFGWDQMSSYRARRAWAAALAGAGHPTLRISLPGTGDSAGSPREPGLVQSWRDSVAQSAHWLRARTGAERVVAIGIGLGGLLACWALAEDAPIDDLILWAVPARGRLLVRELRAYAGMIAARSRTHGDDGRPADEVLELTGFVMSAETAEELEQLRLDELEIPKPQGRRALLLGRDGHDVDKRLREYLERSGVSVSVQEGRDYSRALMAHPQEGRTPQETIERTIAWLAEGDSGARPGGNSGARGGAESAPEGLEREAIEFEHAGTLVRETPLNVPAGDWRAFGILTEPVDRELAPVTAVMLNAGALDHTGPNRAWVEIARRWAARGVTTLRADLPGIGDSDGDERALASIPGLYAEHRVAATVSIMDHLAARGLPERFVLGGLCAGAYWSLHAALADDRVAAALMVNMYAFFFSDALYEERETQETLAVARRIGWSRLLRRDWPRSASAVLSAVRPTRLRRGVSHRIEQAQAPAVYAALDSLRDREVESLLLFSESEGLLAQLRRQGQLERLERWPNLVIEHIPSPDHMFRALRLQSQVHQSLDQALDRVLAAAPPARRLAPH